MLDNAVRTEETFYLVVGEKAERGKLKKPKFNCYGT